MGKSGATQSSETRILRTSGLIWYLRNNFKSITNARKKQKETWPFCGIDSVNNHAASAWFASGQTFWAAWRPSLLNIESEADRQAHCGQSFPAWLISKQKKRKEQTTVEISQNV